MFVLLVLVVLAFVVYLIERSSRTELQKQKIEVERMRLELEMEQLKAKKAETANTKKALLENSD